MTLDKSEISVGTDTEFFLNDANGNLVSAIRYINGGKYNPVALPSGGGVTYDNVCMEFATPVAFSKEEFIAAVGKTMSEAVGMLPEGVVPVQLASADFPPSELEHEEARRFGCDPDFDAWRVAMNEVPEGAQDRTFRSAGGHLHVGYMANSDNDFLLDPWGKIMAVKALDIVLGIPMTLIDTHESAIARRQLYGKAGCHRATDYGVEYRSMSNFWVSSPVLVNLVYDMAREAMRLVRENKLDELIAAITEEEVVRIINTGDVSAAQAVWTNVLSGVLSPEVVAQFNAAAARTFDIKKEWGL